MTKPHSGESSVIELKCKECIYHVRFDKLKPPMPGLVAGAKPTGLTTVYLTCDNPATPHTNGYKINL
jgi:hypothetical protein